MSKKRGTQKQANPKPTNKKQQEQQHPHDEKTEKTNKNQQKFSLYKLLQLDQGPKSTAEQIKKQYKKLAMIYHPDKNVNKEDSQNTKQKFQKLKQAYDILMDPEKKKIYDQTGTLDQNFDQNSFQTAYQFYRKLYKKVQKEDIVQFQKKYRSGQMQNQDLIEFYNSHKGDMVTLLESIPLSRNQDIPRFVKFFQQKIKEGILKSYKIFQKTKAKIRLLKDETEQFEKQQAQRLKSMNELTLAIRNKSNKTFLDSLQAKYGAKKQKVVQKQKGAGQNTQKIGRRTKKQ